MDIGIIMHPHGSPERVEAMRRLVARLRAAGHRVSPRLTFEAGDARWLARAAARARADLVIAAGGDGTVNEVVNGIGRSRWQPRLGIVPMGTANDFAMGLGLPESLEAAVEVAVRGRPRAVDVAEVNRRLFVNVSTGGFGTETTESASPDAKRRLGPLAYLAAGARGLAELRPVRGRFEADGEPLYAGEFLLFAVGNARRTGGGTRLTPRAELADRLLDVLVVPAMPRLDFLALLPDLRAGTHLESPSVLYLKARRLRVRTAAPLSVNADGEPLRARRFDYRLRARPLTVMVP